MIIDFSSFSVGCCDIHPTLMPCFRLIIMCAFYFFQYQLTFDCAFIKAYADGPTIPGDENAIDKL